MPIIIITFLLLGLAACSDNAVRLAVMHGDKSALEKVSPQRNTDIAIARSDLPAVGKSASQSQKEWGLQPETTSPQLAAADDSYQQNRQSEPAAQPEAAKAPAAPARDLDKAPKRQRAVNSSDHSTATMPKKRQSSPARDDQPSKKAASSTNDDGNKVLAEIEPLLRPKSRQEARVAAKSAPTSTQTNSQSVSSDKKAESVKSAESAESAKSTESPKSAALPPAPLQFDWPAKGPIISAFGTQTGQKINDGINIALKEGTAIRAIQEGTVIYSGNEVKGFGNLILIRHNADWVSAYAHNQRLIVERGEKIQRGDIISYSGSSGSVDTPQLHLELRRQRIPVDPAEYLSPRR